MTQRAINFKFFLPTLSAVAFAIVVLIGIVYLKDRYPPFIARPAGHPSVADSGRHSESPNTDGRFWRVHVLLR